MTLPPWAVEFLRGALAAPGHKALLCCGRKNAKSAITAVLMLGYLVGPPAGSRVRAPGARARETRPLVVTGKPVREPHDSTGEPGAGNRPAGFGERGEETYPWDSACGPVAKAPDKPPTPTGYAPLLDSTQPAPRPDLALAGGGRRVGHGALATAVGGRGAGAALLEGDLNERPSSRRLPVDHPRPTARRRGFGATATAGAAIKPPSRSCVAGKADRDQWYTPRSMRVPARADRAALQGRRAADIDQGSHRLQALGSPPPFTGQIDVRPASERTAA